MCWRLPCLQAHAICQSRPILCCHFWDKYSFQHTNLIQSWTKRFGWISKPKQTQALCSYAIFCSNANRSRPTPADWTNKRFAPPKAFLHSFCMLLFFDPNRRPSIWQSVRMNSIELNKTIVTKLSTGQYSVTTQMVSLWRKLS